MERTLRCVVTFSDLPKTAKVTFLFIQLGHFLSQRSHPHKKKSVNDDGNLRSRNFLTQMNTVALLRASTKCDQISCFWSGSSRQHTQSQLNQRNSANCTNHPRKNGSLRIEASSTITSLISKQEKNIHPSRQVQPPNSHSESGATSTNEQIYATYIFGSFLTVTFRLGPRQPASSSAHLPKRETLGALDFLGHQDYRRWIGSDSKVPGRFQVFGANGVVWGGVVCFFAVVVFKFGVNHLNKKTGGTVSYMACL